MGELAFRTVSPYLFLFLYKPIADVGTRTWTLDTGYWPRGIPRSGLGQERLVVFIRLPGWVMGTRHDRAPYKRRSGSAYSLLARKLKALKHILLVSLISKVKIPFSKAHVMTYLEYANGAKTIVLHISVTLPFYNRDSDSA
jgi:hypothetical protein